MAGKAGVLSGGGGKGAFQIGALEWLRHGKGYDFSVFSGVSIGALNGAFEAAGKHDRAVELWQNVTPARVFGKTRSQAINALARLIGKKLSLYETFSMREIIKEITPANMQAEMLVSTVSLVTGEPVTFGKDDPEFMEALVASAAVPLMFPPVHVSKKHRSMIDGAVRCVIPVGSVLPYEPEEIVIISCNSGAALAQEKEPSSALEVFQRSLEIMMHEIFQNDVNAVLRNNNFAEQAAKHGVTLYNRVGKPLKSYPVTIIEPDERLGDTSDFSKSMAKRAFRAGYEKAKKVVP